MQADLDAGPPVAPVFSPESRARVLYVGDSIAFETRDAVQFWIASGNDSIEFAFLGFGQAAICDVIGNNNDLLDATNKLATQVTRFRPHIVVLSFWGVLKGLSKCAPDGQNGAGRGTPAFFDRYRADARSAAQEIISAAAALRGAPKPLIRWVLQGPDKNDKEVARTLNGIYASVAAETAEISGTIDAGHDVSMAAFLYEDVEDGRYTWSQFLPCSGFERDTDFCTEPDAFGGVTKLHKDYIDPNSGAQVIDDIHFCLDSQLDPATGTNEPDSDIWRCNVSSPGVLRWSMKIAVDVKAALGL